MFIIFEIIKYNNKNNKNGINIDDNNNNNKKNRKFTDPFKFQTVSNFSEFFSKTIKPFRKKSKSVIKSRN